MRATLRRPVSPLALVLALLVCLAALPSHASAQAPSLTIFGAGVDWCTANGRPVAAGPQGSTFQLSLANFPAGGGTITITLPDGRVFSLAEATAPGFPPLTPAFPAVAGVPANPAAVVFSQVDASLQLPTTLTWPTGSYTVNVASVIPPPTGTPSAQALRTTAQFCLLPAGFPAQPANLQLTVQATGTIVPSATQPLIPAPPLTVTVFGRGTVGTIAPGVPDVSLWVIQPDGATYPLPVPAASASPGGFGYAGPLPLPPGALPGTYTFVATTPAGPLAGATASTRAQFTLGAPAGAARGNAVLVMSPFTTIVNRGAQVASNPTLTVQGRNFGVPTTTALTPVLVLPNGARLAGAALAPDASGNLLIPPFQLNRSYPTGVYRLEVIQPGTPPALLASISWRVNP